MYQPGAPVPVLSTSSGGKSGGTQRKKYIVRVTPRTRSTVTSDSGAATRSTCCDALTQRVPLGPSSTVARLVVSPPAAKLTDEMNGTAPPHGNSATHPGSTALVATTLSITAADRPAKGVAATGSIWRISPGASGDVHGPVAARVSTTRCPTVVSSSAAGPNVGAGAYEPVTSITTWTSTFAITHMSPAGPSPTMAAPGRAPPPRKLRFDASGASVPQGNATRNPSASAPVTVRLTTAARASPGRCWPASGMLRISRAGIRVAPGSSRVS